MGIRIRTGQAPNLSWWQLEQMTDEEIKEFNNRYMHEEEMITIKEHEQFAKELREKTNIAIWNAAIEAAALIVQPKPHVDEERRCEDIVAEILKLKKE